MTLAWQERNLGGIFPSVVFYTQKSLYCCSILFPRDQLNYHQRCFKLDVSCDSHMKVKELRVA